MPSSGGGTKLIRTLRVGEMFGLGVGIGVVDGVSWANAAQIDINPTKSAAVDLFVMSSEVETSVLVSGETPMTVRDSLTSLRCAPTSLGMTSNVIPPVYVWEKVIAPFAIAQKFFIDMIRGELILQSVETTEVIQRSFRSVLFRCFGLHQKCPIA